jgi:hypothetical protein
MNWKVPKDMVDQEKRVRELEQEVERLRKASKKAMGMMAEGSVSGNVPIEDVSPIIEVLRSALDGGGGDDA